MPTVGHCVIESRLESIYLSAVSPGRLISARLLSAHEGLLTSLYYGWCKESVAIGAVNKNSTPRIVDESQTYMQG